MLLMMLISELTFEECGRGSAVSCKRVQGCRGHPNADVQWRQTAELPSCRTLKRMVEDKYG